MGQKIRIAVGGGTGYSGVELLRLLALHPHVELVRVTSEQHAGKFLEEVYPAFRGRLSIRLEPLDAGRGERVDLFFSALPHGTAANACLAALRAGARVVDLSADFRLRDPDLCRRWYGEHPAPGVLAEAVYGIPEFAREKIRGAKVVANPGCYPTGALIALVPLARAGAIGESTIVVDAKSGASGSGRSARTDLLFCEVEEGLHPYNVGRHRHQPEIEQELAAVGGPSSIVFTPHLVPIRRGLLSTIYIPLGKRDDPAEIYRAAYADEPFVQLLGADVFPDVRDVRGTNQVQMGWKALDGSRTAVVVTAIDNLGKGAAGQAVQNMNAMFGFDERTGLEQIAAVP